MADKPTDNNGKPTPAAAPKARAGWIWIINHEERVRVLVLRGATSSVSKLPQPGARIDLAPGANVIDVRPWDAWKAQNADREVEGELVKGQAAQLLEGKIPSDPHRARRAEMAGRPYLVEGPVVKSRETPLDGIDEPKALELVAEILDEAMLARLLKLDKRAAVVEALRAKIESIHRSIASAAIAV